MPHTADCTIPVSVAKVRLSRVLATIDPTASPINIHAGHVTARYREAIALADAVHDLLLVMLADVGVPNDAISEADDRLSDIFDDVIKGALSAHIDRVRDEQSERNDIDEDFALTRWETPAGARIGRAV